MRAGDLRVSILEPSKETLRLADLIAKRFKYKSQLTPKDFKLRKIHGKRALKRDPAYRPDFIPPPRKSTIEVEVSRESRSLLQPLARTEQYGEDESTMVLACFIRWYNQTRVKDRVSKLTVRG